jgi:hypothetical protein
MALPFTTHQFFALFESYNETVWPAQIVLVVLAVAMLALLRRPGALANRTVAAGLALLWLWVGLAYHLAFFTAINPLAYGFASLSVLGSLLFAWEGLVRGRLRFSPGRNGETVVGLLFIAYALVGYPLVCIAGGHSYPAMPTFGLPCPTTLFTIGVLLCADRPIPRGVVVVPVLWALVGVQAAFLLGVPADLALGLAAVAGAWLMIRRERHALRPARA